MAIEVLEGHGHNDRHDLESFFYVFCESLFAKLQRAGRRIWQAEADFGDGIQEAIQTLRMQKEATWINPISIVSSMNFLISLMVSKNSLRSYAWHYFKSDSEHYSRGHLMIPIKYLKSMVDFFGKAIAKLNDENK